MKRIHLTPARGAIARIHYPDVDGTPFGYVVEYERSSIGCGFRIVEITSRCEGRFLYQLGDDPFGTESFDHGDPSATGEVRWDGDTIWRLEEQGQESDLSGTFSLLAMIRIAFMDALRIYLDARPERRADAGVDLPALDDGEVSPVPQVSR